MGKYQNITCDATLFQTLEKYVKHVGGPHIKSQIGSLPLYEEGFERNLTRPISGHLGWINHLIIFFNTVDGCFCFSIMYLYSPEEVSVVHEIHREWLHSKLRNV